MKITRFGCLIVEGGDILTAESQRELENVLAEIKQRPAPDLMILVR